MGRRQFAIEDAPIPPLGDRDVLVAVHAAGITFAEFDWDLSWTRLDGSDRTPVIPAHEFSGAIASIGICGQRSCDTVTTCSGSSRSIVTVPPPNIVAVPAENLVGKPHTSATSRRRPFRSPR